MVWIEAEAVGVGVMRRWISFSSDLFVSLASSSDLVSSVICDVRSKMHLLANSSFDFINAISAVSELICFR